MAPSTHVLELRTAPGEGFSFDAGQYVTFFLTRNGRSITRSYSIFSPAGRTEAFSLLVKQVPGGYGSTYLCGLVPGSHETLTVLAPVGRFVLADPGDRAVVLVATGTGLAPFRPMLRELRAHHPTTPTLLIYGNRFLEDVVLLDELRTLESDWPAFRFGPVLSRPPPSNGWHGAVGHVQDVLAREVPDASRSDIYLCGVPEMVNQTQELALQLGCPKARVFVERY